MYIPARNPRLRPDAKARMPHLIARQFTGDAGHDTNVTIGIIVAVVLVAFLVGVGAFLYTYRDSIRFTARRRRRRKGGPRRKSTGSSKSGKSDGGGDHPEPGVPIDPPPPSAPPADAP